MGESFEYNDSSLDSQFDFAIYCLSEVQKTRKREQSRKKREEVMKERKKREVRRTEKKGEERIKKKKKCKPV